MAVSPRPDGIGMAPPNVAATGGLQTGGLQTVTQPEGSNLDQAFVADRAMFWGRFTGFIKLGIGAVILVLLFLLFFVYF